MSLFAHSLIDIYLHLQGAARRVSAQRKTIEVESVAAAGKQEVREVVKKLFRAEVITFYSHRQSKYHTVGCSSRFFGYF